MRITNIFKRKLKKKLPIMVFNWDDPNVELTLSGFIDVGTKTPLADIIFHGIVSES